MDRWYVYILRSPLSLEAKYVGCSVEPVNRFCNHIYGTHSKGLREWMERTKLTPSLEIVGVFYNARIALQAEQALINLHHANEIPVFNSKMGFDKDQAYPKLGRLACLARVEHNGSRLVFDAGAESLGLTTQPATEVEA